MKKILILITLMSLLMVGIANAVPTLSLDTTTWQSGTNISIALTDGNNVTYVTIYGSSSSTANSSTSVIANITNTTGTNFMGTKANFTLGSGIVLEDSNDYSITATTTGTGDSDGITLSATTATVDRTAPTTPTSVQPATGTQTNDTLNIVASVNQANTVSCTLTFNSIVPKGASKRNTLTESGGTCSATYTSVSDQTYEFSLTATDNTNSSSTSNRYITVDADEVSIIGLSGVLQEKEQKQAEQKQTSNLLILVIIIVIAYLLLGKKTRR